MKKLLILMLVLGLASVSQAVTIDLTVGGATEYVAYAGENITVELIADLQCTAFELSAVAETDELRSQILIGAEGGSVAGTIGNVEAISAPTGTVTFAGYVNNYKGLLFDAASWYGNVAGGNVIAIFSYTIASDWDEETDYYVAPLPDGTTYYYMEGESADAGLSYGGLIVEGEATNVEIGGLHIIPEPATMALLGLGSLFLLRRRK